MSSPNVAIVGAGPSGCMLGRILHRAGVSCTVFEAEASLDFRSQGGTLDLHEGTGLAAMKRAGLYDDFLNYARFDGEAIAIADKRLIKLVSAGGTSEKTSRGRPEIDRPRLREILVKSLPSGMIKWSHRLRKVDPDGNLHFDDGVVRGFDLVIGADGAFSKVRPLLTDTQPYYSGVYGHWLSIPKVKERAPELHKLVNRGSLFSFSDGKGLIAQQMGDGSMAVGLYNTSREPPQGYGRVDLTTAKERIRSYLSDWNPILISITQDFVEGDAQMRPLYMLPVGEQWIHRSTVTLIGDAAHLMTPFAGEGVNVAFADSMKLAEAIISASQQRDPDGVVLDRKVKEFEHDMFLRAAKVQGLTKRMMECMFFTPGAPWTSIEEYCCNAAEDTVPWFAFPFIKCLIYGYFLVLKLLYKPKDV